MTTVAVASCGGVGSSGVIPSTAKSIGDGCAVTPNSGDATLDATNCVWTVGDTTLAAVGLSTAVLKTDGAWDTNGTGSAIVEGSRTAGGSTVFPGTIVGTCSTADTDCVTGNLLTTGTGDCAEEPSATTPTATVALPVVLNDGACSDTETTCVGLTRAITVVGVWSDAAATTTVAVFVADGVADCAADVNDSVEDITDADGIGACSPTPIVNTVALNVALPEALTDGA